jgi:hypothetical protein
MNIKRIFGSLLTALGIAGLIYTAVLLVNNKGNTHNIKLELVYGILSLVFFIAGIGLIRTIKDEA